MKDIDSLMIEYAEETKGNKEDDLKKLHRGCCAKKISSHRRKCLIISIALMLVFSLIIVIAFLPFASSEGEVPIVPDNEVPPIVNPFFNLGQMEEEIFEIAATRNNNNIFYGEVSAEEYYDYTQYLTLPYIDADDYECGNFWLLVDENSSVSGYGMYFCCKDFYGLWNVAVIKLQEKSADNEDDLFSVLCDAKEIINLNDIEYYHFIDTSTPQDVYKNVFIYEDEEAIYQVYVRSFTDFAPEELLNIMYGENSPYKRT